MRGYSVIIPLSFLFALMLQVMPLPEAWLLWRPNWTALVLIYWCIITPYRVGVFHGFLIGMLIDLLQGTPLGENALLYATIAFLTLLLYQRMRIYALWRQAMLVTIVLALMQLFEQWLRAILLSSPLHLEFVYAALLGGILWPWLFTLMQIVRRRFASF
ncbi:rod shape-determining protein MreD [Kushneria indalinina]|uniref:Rod shape-determining protein MreD n=1 Tax=Kushneria indalinina DSM 14324 TaxID=1122140 RepID=A0A3D9E0I6_9GAMM|nr:rod shape-determining protein MreD [Kushneria indalinina]REC96562.1 rod shape-determining protein MreD [Kushneria indalinina DSM 14324]